MQTPVPGKFYIDEEDVRCQVMIDTPVNPVVIPDEPAPVCVCGAEGFRLTDGLCDGCLAARDNPIIDKVDPVTPRKPNKRRK